MLKKTLKQIAKLISRKKKEKAGSIFNGTGRLKRSIKEKVIGNEKTGYAIQ